MKGKPKNDNTFVRIFEIMLNSVFKISQDIKEGDLIGAGARILIIAFVFLFAIFLVAVIAKLENVAVLCVLFFCFVFILTIIFLLLIFHSPPYDRNLAKGQEIRALSIHPSPIQ